MSPEELRRRIDAFPRWHYAIDLGGELTPIFDPAHAVRHAERRRHFFDPLVRWLGGLDGRTVLDLGCNAGFWSLAAAEAGGIVTAMDGRAMHVAQSELVREARGIPADRWRIAEADVTTAALGGPYDVVLCLGLLYHVRDPVGLLERAAAACRDVLVVDTEVHPQPGPLFRLGVETPEDPRSAVGTRLVLVPTPDAVIRTMSALGFHTITLRPRFSDWTGSEDYRAGRRRVFVCARSRDLSTFPAEIERPGPIRQVGRMLRWTAGRALRRG